MTYSDFKDFKSFSKELRILSIRQTERGTVMKWPKVMEIMVSKKYPTRLFFKTSHLNKEYDSIDLKRLTRSVSDIKLTALNSEPPKLSKEKYKDLTSMCKAETPIIRLPELQEFYKSLSHNQQ